MLRSVILGCGSYLPERILSNQELAARVDTSDEWIVQRTGIRQRHYKSFYINPNCFKARVAACFSASLILVAVP